MDHRATTGVEPVQRYLVRHAEVAPEVKALPAPAASLRLCVVIPALAECDRIVSVLDSLDAGSQRLEEAEIIVVVNNARDAASEIREDNQKTMKELQVRTGRLPVLVLDRSSSGSAFSPDVAGVGAARRAGMDLALHRLVAAGQPARSAMACLDADSPVAPGYVDALLGVFESDNPPFAGICSYRHPIPEEKTGAFAILAYELWLRYIEHAVRLADSPYAFQTIGSCMVASCEGYARADGMPRRRAGEDFYFLQKMVKAGGPERIARVPGAMVFPSPRVSDRVPFGTGRAMRRCREEGPGRYLFVEPPQAYLDLRSFFRSASRGFFEAEHLKNACSGPLAAFILRQDGWKILGGLRANAHGPGHFTRAVHNWFDSLQVVRFAHQSKEARGGVWIFEALYEVLEALGFEDWVSDLPIPGPSAEDLHLFTLWLDRLRQPDERAQAPVCRRSST
jgi:hypothetical protein